jgi:hypothetical protein
MPGRGRYAGAMMDAMSSDLEASRRGSLHAAPVSPEPEFVLHEEIGRGGMATVWSAAQVGLGREVAVKRVREPGDKAGERLLLREAMLTGQLEHPNIVPVHQLVVDARGPAVVMKRIAGKTWDQLIESPKVNLDAHLDILVQTMNAVAFAHSKGVLHRDIKPENVMVGDFGEVYLLDWGVARRLSDPPSSAVVGTASYMAPEMADGKADERTDVFLLGATLHEVLTGALRHEAADQLGLLYAALYVEPYDYPPDVPAELGELCNRACARAPEERFPSVLAMREALHRFREHRAAKLLNERALAQLVALEACLGGERSSYSEAQRLFSDARHGFDAALRVWPDNVEAQVGLSRAVRAMLDHELARRNLAGAQALLELLGPDESECRARVAALELELEREQQRVASLERDRDPTVGAIGRRRAYLSMGAITALMTLALLARRLLLPNQGVSTLRLAVVGAVVLAIMLGVVFVWRRHATFNFINQRIAHLTTATLAVSFVSRLFGHFAGMAPEHVLMNDAFILGLGGIALAPYHWAGPWLTGVSFAVAGLGSLEPAIIDELFIALSILAPAALFLLRRRGPQNMASSARSVSATPG